MSSGQQIHSTKTLADIYRLPERDIEEILCAQGEIWFSMRDEAFLVRTPIFDGSVRYDQRFKQLKRKLAASDYTFLLDSMILKVSSDIHYPSSFLLLDDFPELVEQHMDITEDTSILLSKNPRTALFFGHGEVTNRLADDFEESDGTVSVADLLNWRQSNVKLL